MSELTLGVQPGFTDLDASTFNAGNTASETTLKALNADAQFAAVRNEQFWGYYRNGETVALPVSPADGYVYSRSECLYSWSIYSTGNAGADLAGTHTPPAPGSTTGAGDMLQLTAQVDQSSGVIAMGVAYYSSSQTNTTNGILMVITHAQRMR
jgi:hypothetical protein